MWFRQHALALVLLGQLAAVPLAGQVRSASTDVNVTELGDRTELLAADVLSLALQLQELFGLRTEIAATVPIHPGDRATADELAAFEQAHEARRSRLGRVEAAIGAAQEKLSQAERELDEFAEKLRATTAQGAKQQQYLDALNAYMSEFQAGASALLQQLDLRTAASTPAKGEPLPGAVGISDELDAALKGLMATAGQPPSGGGGTLKQ